MAKQGGIPAWRAAGRQWALRMAAGRAGRIALHLAALARDGEVRWHLRGIARELAARVIVPRRSEESGLPS